MSWSRRMSWSRGRARGRVRGGLPAALLAVVLAAVTVAGTVGAAAGQPDARALDVPGVVLLLIGPAAVALWRSSPPAVFAVAVLAVTGYLAAGYPFGPVFLSPVIALCLAVVAGYRRSTYALTAVAFAGLLALHLTRYPGVDGLAGASGWLAFLAAVIAGCEWWRARRAGRGHPRGDRPATGLQERLRIARDLHDALGHHVSLINVQGSLRATSVGSGAVIPGQYWLAPGRLIRRRIAHSRRVPTAGRGLGPGVVIVELMARPQVAPCAARPAQ